MTGDIALALLFILAIMLVWIALTMLVQLLFYVPTVPTPCVVMETMLQCADLRDDDIIVEIGAGDARLMIEAKKRAPGATVIGYEIARTVWFLGSLRLWRTRTDADLFCEDFRHADLSRATVIFAYMSPRMMRDLLRICREQIAPGTRIVSHAFALPEVMPSRTFPVRVDHRMTTVYLYVWGQKEKKA